MAYPLGINREKEKECLPLPREETALSLREHPPRQVAKVVSPQVRKEKEKAKARTGKVPPRR